MTKQELKQFTNKRTNLIESLIDLMGDRIKKNQKAVLERILENFVEKLDTDENGKVINNDKNRKLLFQIDDAFKEYRKKEAVETIQLLLKSVNKIMTFNQQYFTAMEGKAAVLPIMPKVKEFMKQWLGIKGDVAEPNGYIERLVQSDAAKIALKNTAMKIVIGQEGFENALTQVRELVNKNNFMFGEFGNHARSFTYDLYSQIDRATADVVRNDLKLSFAIYEGGIIKTSRLFCEEHEGHVYHVSEIMQFDPKEAKPPNYNPLTDLGGYNCRHHLNWISNAMAKSLRPDVQYFIDGTAEENDIKPPLNSIDEIEKERKKRGFNEQTDF